MRAFVLSGGGRLGPIQVGALRALLEYDIRPAMIVGCSAGALNAAYLAREISLENLESLADIWRSVSTQEIYPGGRVNTLWRLLTGRDSLHDNRRFYAFLQKKGITPAATFGDYADWVQLYVTATTLRTGELQVFGDNPHDRVLDALMASTALTPMHPPWVVNGERYVDGGTVTPLPLRVAIERGATEIYSLYIVEDIDVGSPGQIVRGVGGVLTRTVGTMFKLQAEHDLLLAQYADAIKLHNIELMVKSPPGPVDFSQADRLIEAGYQMTQDYLARQVGHKQADAAKGLRWWQRTTERLRRSMPESAGAGLPAPGLPD